jgi:hypothetical protein
MQALTLSRAVSAFRLDEPVEQEASTPAEPVKLPAPVLHNRRRNPVRPHLVLASRRD